MRDHGALGIVAFIFTCLQFLLGWARPKESHRNRGAWLAAHRTVGTLTLVFGIVAVATGIKAMSVLNATTMTDDWTSAAVIVGSVILVRCVTEDELFLLLLCMLPALEAELFQSTRIVLHLPS